MRAKNRPMTATQTPTTACCAGANKHCPANPSDWAVGGWQALDFQIDEPFLFQYDYASTGTGFTAQAIGDLDCDGTSITYAALGTSNGGNPAVRITEPPPNTD